MRGYIVLGRTIMLYGSALGFWYLVMPDHWVKLIMMMVIFGIIFGISFIIIGNIVNYVIKRLRRRYKWAKQVFINPSR